MAIQTIVEFMRNSVGTPDAPPPAAPVAARAVGGGGPAEVVYITVAARVIAALEGKAGMTARQIFVAAGTGEFAAFQCVLGEMVARGVLHQAGRDPQFGDDIFALTAPPIG